MIAPQVGRSPLVAYSPPSPSALSGALGLEESPRPGWGTCAEREREESPGSVEREVRAAEAADSPSGSRLTGCSLASMLWYCWVVAVVLVVKVEPKVSSSLSSNYLPQAGRAGADELGSWPVVVEPGGW